MEENLSDWVFYPVTSDGLIKITISSYKTFLTYKPWSNNIPEKFSGTILLRNIETAEQFNLWINLFKNNQKIVINSQG